MKIGIKKDMVKEIFGRMIFIGAEPSYEYDSEKREYDYTKMTRNVIHIGCEKFSDSLDVQVETLANIDIPKFAEIEFDDLVYDPYATVSTFNSGDTVRNRGVLNERFRCVWVREAGKPVSAQNK